MLEDLRSSEVIRGTEANGDAMHDNESEGTVSATTRRVVRSSLYTNTEGLQFDNSDIYTYV